MKTKTSNKFNIWLIAITLLLLFVAGVSAFGKTNSWLVDSDDVGFVLNVDEIDITIKQGDRQINNKGYIYLGTDVILPDTEYLTKTTTGTIVDNSVTITNNEIGMGYYIRFQAIAVVNGASYNITNCINTSDFAYKEVTDGAWMYSVDENNNNIAMTAGETLTLMQDILFPENFVNLIQGQYFKLHLFLEGSATGDFTSIWGKV